MMLLTRNQFETERNGERYVLSAKVSGVGMCMCLSKKVIGDLIQSLLFLEVSDICSDPLHHLPLGP